MAHFAGEDTLIEPLKSLGVVVGHQLVVVILETHSVGLGQVLVDGEVVTEDADAADLTSMPGPGHQRGPIYRIVLRHLEVVTPLDVEADLVLEKNTIITILFHFIPLS